MTAPVTWPRWILELGRCLPVRSQIVLSGNIRDFYVMQTVGGVALVSMHQCLWERLSDRGFEFLVAFHEFLTLFRICPGVLWNHIQIQLRAHEVLQLSLNCRGGHLGP